MVSPAKAYPDEPIAAAATEPSAEVAAGDAPGLFETRADAAASVVEVPVRAYSGYEPGVVIAQKFQLVRVLGEGGMGSVWVAKNLALDVHIALKLIRAELAQSVPGLGERLLQEARAAASIDHPAVIKIFDFGLTELRDPFIAMELLHGETLADAIKRRSRVSPVRAVQTILPIADALLAAHERGIVHRDLKPDNIFLSRGWGNGLEPKVLDFGIAKFNQTLAPNLTCAGTILGSPAYMSPEQARGETDVDGRTDIWALCVVLYEAITGQLPFNGDNYNALMYAILEEQPKTFAELNLNEALLWSIVARGLEKTRERRCSDMFELGRALAVWLLDRGVQEDVCHALLKSKWLERGRLQTAAAKHSFFPSDPPVEELRARAAEQEPMPVDAHGRPSSGVLLRPATDVEPGHVFGTQFTETGVGVRAVANQGRVFRLFDKAPARWIWLTVVGTAISFSAAVALQALSGPRVLEEEPKARPAVEVQRPSQIPLATIATAVEMPRPLASAPVASASASRRVYAETRGPPARSQRAWDSKSTRSELKNPFR